MTLDTSVIVVAQRRDGRMLWRNGRIAVMGLNIKNPEVEALIAEVAKLTGESKTQAIRGAMLEKREKLFLLQGGKDLGERRDRALQRLWATIPSHLRGRKPLTKRQMDKIVGYGRNGY